MFSIPYWRSIGIHVLLAIAFAIIECSASGNSIHATETCVNVTGEIICYFKGSEKHEKWHEASQICSSLNSTLPVIRDTNDQAAIAGYLKLHMSNSTIWTAGNNFTYSTWTWLNGEPLEGSVQAQPQKSGDGDGEKEYAALDEDLKFSPLAANNELPYICQYEGAYCSSSTDIIVSGKCLRLINDKKTWYDARNQCFMSNGDLTVISDEVHEHLKHNLTLSQSYWIGLRKKYWRWTFNAESNDEIKYTNWESNTFSRDGKCIFIDASDGKWKTDGCIQPRGVVCQRSQSVTFPATTTKTSVEKVDSFTSVSKEGTGDGSQSSVSNTLLFAAVGAGIVIIICIIVIVVFVLRTKKGSVKGNRPTRLSDSSPQYKREEFDSRITNTPVYTSVNESAKAPVTTSDDIRGVYAEIPLSTANQSEDGATNQQPGTVYASLEFNEDPTCLKPDETPANTTAPVKVGPLGDIYAMPDANGHAVTTPGNESASQSVKVTPQGEVVYANLQTEMLGKEQASEEHYQRE